MTGIKIVALTAILGSSGTILANGVGALPLDEPEKWTVTGILGAGCALMYREMKQQQRVHRDQIERERQTHSQAMEVERQLHAAALKMERDQHAEAIQRERSDQARDREDFRESFRRLEQTILRGWGPGDYPAPQMPEVRDNKW